MTKKAKRYKALPITVGTADRWAEIMVDNCDGEDGYYLGGTVIYGSGFQAVNCHVEAIEVTAVNGVSPVRSSVTAVNPDYQNRIDRYCEANDGELPQLVKIGRKKYYVHISPYAQ